jgi:hypothetical protein
MGFATVTEGSTAPFFINAEPAEPTSRLSISGDAATA